MIQSKSNHLKYHEGLLVRNDVQPYGGSRGIAGIAIREYHELPEATVGLHQTSEGIPDCRHSGYFALHPYFVEAIGT